MKYEIATLCDTSGKVIGGFKCKVVDENEYNKLIKKTQIYLENKQSEIRKLNKDINELKNEIEQLKKDIKVLKGEE